MRLTPRGFAVNLVTYERYQLMVEKRRLRDGLIEFITECPVKAQAVNEAFVRINDALGVTGTEQALQPVKEGCRLKALVLRPQLTIGLLAREFPQLRSVVDALPDDRREEIIEAAEVLIKYDGYIKREQQIADKIKRLESIPLGDRFDYSTITSISTEARQKLERIRPATVAQASRIPGVSPADINILLLLCGR